MGFVNLIYNHSKFFEGVSLYVRFNKLKDHFFFLKTEVFKNGGSASLCGRAKTEVFENDYVTGIGMSQLKKAKRMFSYTFSVV